jgi:hypothetical protein
MEELLHEDEIPVGRAKDLRGQVFGRLTVLYRVKNHGATVFWKVACSCGTIKEVAGQALISGRTVSCGCYNKEKCLGKKPGNFKDLTGMRFGNLTVIKEAPTNSQTKWECLCDCGNTTVVFANNLLKGNHTTSCGCKKFSRYEEDLVGKVFNRLTVLEKSSETCATGSMWKCKCECGKVVAVSRNHLVTEHTQSCGCYQKDQTSLANSGKIETGTRFGRLTVVKEAYKRNLLTFWECKCDCGNISYVPTGHLNSGHTKSCGCLTSQGEFEISALLNKNDIAFEAQKSFVDCKYNEQDARLPRFDFYINNSYLLEFDGIQHFEPIEYFGGEEQFLIQTRRDQYKNQWCKENNIPLIRIPYTKLDSLCIEDLMLETTQFRVV